MLRFLKICKIYGKESGIFMEEQLKIKLNKILKEVRLEAKLDYCVYCNKEASSFCNSHTIPKFILKKIDDEGMIYNSHFYTSFGLMDLIKKENGLKETGTFQLICRDCDSKIFQDYEDENSIMQNPTNKMMAEIALKNILKLWYKRNYEICLYNKIQKLSPFSPSYFMAIHHNEINDLDLKELKIDFKRFKTIIEKNLKSGMRLVFWHKCDYTVPLAFQGPICLYGDLNGQIINDIYNYSSKLVMQYIHVCVFPLEQSSIVMVFYHKDDTNYRAFERQFNRLTLDKKLQLISFIIVNYSEDFFISKKANESIIKNPIMNVTTENNINILANSYDDLKSQEKQKLRELENYEEFPNLLNEDYKLNNTI